MTTTQVAAQIQASQLRNAALAMSMAAAFVALAAVIHVFNGDYLRAALPIPGILGATWIVLRARAGFLDTRERWLGIAVAFYWLAIPSWTNPNFTDTWLILAVILNVLTVTATFGLSQLKPALAAVIAFLGTTFVLRATSGLELLQIAQQPGAAPAMIFWIYLILALGFLYLLHRQAELALELTQQAAGEATAAGAAESRFLSNMSHEIRNPLHGIQGLLEEIRHQAREHEVRSDAELALQVTERLKALLNDVLDYQKIREGEFVITPACFNSNELWRAIKGTTRAMLKQNEKDLDIAFHPSADIPPWIYGDQNRIYQIAINLVSNAVKFTKTGGIVVRSDYDLNKQQLILSVTDTGPGIPEATIGQLFQRFKQGSEGLAKGHTGTGLGLAIAHELAHLMNGSLGVESTVGKGSTFSLTLPLPMCEPTEPPPSTGLLPDNDAGLIDLEGLTLLCVDDDLLNLRVLKMPLAKARATLLSARGGEEALEVLANHRVHMLLTDISMPEMDGTELQQIVSKRYPGLPVIAVTGNAMPSDIKQYMDMGFADVLEKPFTREILLAAITKNIIAAFKAGFRTSKV